MPIIDHPIGQHDGSCEDLIRHIFSFAREEGVMCEHTLDEKALQIEHSFNEMRNKKNQTQPCLIHAPA
jgi:hypothetical protein